MNESLPPNSRASSAWSPEDLRELADIWVNRVTSHLNDITTGETRVSGDFDPRSLITLAEQCLNDAQQETDIRGRFDSLLTKMLRHGQNLHHPGYTGHQVPASSPVAGLFDAIGSMTNQPMAIFEMGPWATAAEFAVVRRMCEKVGWNADRSAGLLTSGGSLANLTALLTARNVAFPDSWEHGVPDEACLLVHTDAHYCILRAAGILGIGTSNVRKVGLNADRQMDPDGLEQQIQSATAEGRKIIAVCACSCATPIGAFDHLNDIANVCERHGVWLHVDAAHGGGVLMSPRHRHLMDGIERADSIVWDAHKMMFVPALCGAVLYRDAEHRYHAFQQNAPYLFDSSNPGMFEYDGGLKTLECTKRSLAFGLWGLWSMFGDKLFEELVDQMFDQASCLYKAMKAADDFDCPYEPQCNIVVFRHLPADLSGRSRNEVNAFQQQLRAAVIADGKHYIVQTTIDGTVVLRATMMNPLTTEAHIESLLTSLRRCGRALLKT